MRYRFRDFHLDSAARELRRGEEVVALPASAFDCLLYLLENRQRAVGKDELIAAVWGRSDASDALLAQTLTRVRRAVGDTGNAQHTIQTVPRFGYRWVAEVDEGANTDASGTPDIRMDALPSTPIDASVIDAPALPAYTPPPAAGKRSRWLAGGILLLLTLGFAIVAVFLPRATQEVARKTNQASERSNVSNDISQALVFPAEVNAGEEWAWLRLGLMDLVANRLRRGELATAVSETVVGLLDGDKSAGPVAYDDPRFAAAASLRIVPRASFDGEHWQVRLDTLGGDSRISIEANAADILTAGREASDRLLLALGHVPPADVRSGPAALDELLQRTRAAMLANQFDLAKRLIANAPIALRTHPEVVLREANVELRAGDYRGAAVHLQSLLDSASGDEWRHLRGRALITLAAIHIRRNEADSAEGAYAEAIDLLADSSDANARGLAWHGRGLVALVRGDTDAAASDLGLARTEMVRSGSALGVAQIDMNLALLQTMRHRPAVALSALQAVEQRLQRIGAREELIHTYASEAENQIELLDFAGALANSERFWPPEAYSANVRTAWRMAMIRARALLGVGRLEEARTLVTRIRSEADPGQDEVAMKHAELIAAELAMFDRDFPEAERSATRATSPILRTGEDMSWYVRAWALKVATLRLNQRVDEAASEATALEAWARSRGDDWMRAIADATRAGQLSVDKRSDEALRLYAQALGLMERSGTPFDIVSIAEPYLLGLIERDRLADAQAVNGQISAWAEQDLRAARVQVHIYRALKDPFAAAEAESVVARLSGNSSAPSAP